MAGAEDADDPTPDSRADDGHPAGTGGGGRTSGAAWQEDSARRVRAGTALISATDLLDPNFARSIIYVIEHNDAGSLGVVLNRMSQTAVHNLLPQWTDLAASPRALFVGGPVKQDAALCLGVVKPGADISGFSALRPIDGRVVLVDLDADPEDFADVLDGVRIFAGYAGWGIGQLDDEIDQGSWMLASALPRDVLAPPTIDVWSDIVRRQPWPIPLLATHPIDVSVN
ncbi:YqgE/AlgH family protein [Gordonia sp. ABSL1-1]|uniref:YqgE/AlgH family protein n=1 Tax=Gordonia sp. ABSL1-1 TaxID=3053923 RepID=UPI002572C217|nr:YqgE/AlgH family protein [Gordonia sp. ABSL1-1]MDL9936590.1 YqgE/AlgH family protein [Gordonia sp. ABSL1-1]